MTIKELYSVIDGDYEDLMLRIPKENLIEKFVRKYVDSSEFNDLIAAYEAKDYKKLFEVSHTLKGMSANLSFTQIQKNISEICESVRNGEPQTDISELIEIAKKNHEVLVDAVGQLG